MRLDDDDRETWNEGAELFAEATGTAVNVSAFLRVAAREKLAKLKEEKKRKGK